MKGYEETKNRRSVLEKFVMTACLYESFIIRRLKLFDGGKIRYQVYGF